MIFESPIKKKPYVLYITKPFKPAMWEGGGFSVPMMKIKRYVF